MPCLADCYLTATAGSLVCWRSIFATTVAWGRGEYTAWYVCVCMCTVWSDSQGCLWLGGDAALARTLRWLLQITLSFFCEEQVLWHTRSTYCGGLVQVEVWGCCCVDGHMLYAFMHVLWLLAHCWRVLSPQAGLLQMHCRPCGKAARKVGTQILCNTADFV
jgi:hypothetical protein